LQTDEKRQICESGDEIKSVQTTLCFGRLRQSLKFDGTHRVECILSAAVFAREKKPQKLRLSSLIAASTGAAGT